MRLVSCVPPVLAGRVRGKQQHLIVLGEQAGSRFGHQLHSQSLPLSQQILDGVLTRLLQLHAKHVMQALSAQPRPQHLLKPAHSSMPNM